jgi:hypothetical protein
MKLRLCTPNTLILYEQCNGLWRDDNEKENN